MLLIQSLSSFRFLVIVSLIQRPVLLEARMFISCSALPLSRYKSDVRLQSRRSGRIILRTIRWRFSFSITRAVQESGQYGSVIIFLCLPSCVVSYVTKPFASPCFHDVLREMVRSSSRSSESMKTSNLSLFNLRFLSESRKHVPQVQCTMPVVQYVEQLWAHLEVLQCCPCCGSCPSTSRWMGWTLDPFPGRLSALRDLDAFQIDESTFWLPSLWVSCCWTVECGNPWVLTSMLP